MPKGLIEKVTVFVTTWYNRKIQLENYSGFTLEVKNKHLKQFRETAFVVQIKSFVLPLVFYKIGTIIIHQIKDIQLSKL